MMHRLSLAAVLATALPACAAEPPQPVGLHAPIASTSEATATSSTPAPVAPTASASAAPASSSVQPEDPELPPPPDLTGSVSGFDDGAWLKTHGIAEMPVDDACWTTLVTEPVAPNKKINVCQCYRGFSHEGHEGLVCMRVNERENEPLISHLVLYRVDGSSLRLALDAPYRWLDSDCAPGSRCSVRLSAIFRGKELWLDDEGDCASRRGVPSTGVRAWQRICQSPGRYTWQGGKLVRTGKIPKSKSPPSSTPRQPGMMPAPGQWP